MRSPMRLLGVVTLLAGSLVAVPLPGAASSAASPDALLYELTENMTLDPLPPDVPLARKALAALQGSSRVGTPLCPDAVLVTNPRAQTCTITALGQDDISTVTGLGTLAGTWATVVQGDNPVDGPEFVVLTGSFAGTIDLSPTLAGVPLGSIAGDMLVDANPFGVPAGPYPFTGTFRLPFSKGKDGRASRAARGRDAFYLGDSGRPFPVKKDEHSLGVPTVRLEIQFVGP